MSSWKQGLAVGIALFALSGSLTHAEKLNSAERLRKLSLSLRGNLPAADEYSQLEALRQNPEKSESFLREKAKAYAESTQFENKFFERTMEAFRFNKNQDLSTLEDSAAWSRSSFNFDGEYRNNRISSSFSFVLRSGLRNRKSWNELMANPDFFAAAELMDANATFTAELPAFKSQIDNLQKDGLSEDQAIRVSLGMEKLAEKNDSLNQLLVKLEKLDPAGATRVRAMKDNVAKISMLNLLIYQMKIAKKINDAQYAELKAHADQSLKGNIAHTKSYRLFGTSFRGTNQNFELYKTALGDLKENRDNKPKWHALMSQAATQALRNEDGNNTSLPGVIGSQQFVDRYKQTEFSPSAALFNLYLCDEMKPVALGGVDLSLRAARGLIPLGAKTETKNIDESLCTRHASDPKCQGCHRKLDPIQDMFKKEVNISEANPLTIVYDDESGKEYRVKISSYNELMPTIQKQDAYLTCQTRRFWNWYVGADVPLVGAKLTEMKKAYAEATSVQDFVQTMVNRPEFSEVGKPDELVTFEAVKPLLARCQNCHRGEELVPALTSMPFSMFGNDAEHTGWIKKIAKATDVMNGSRRAQMPPGNAGWRLEEDQVVLLARWLANGAPDSAGKPTISETTRQELLNSAAPEVSEKIESARERFPQFGPGWQRYLEGRDFLRVFSQILPEYATTDKLPYRCASILQNANSFGFPDPMTGRPASKTPTFNFISVWSSCLGDISPFEAAFDAVMMRLSGVKSMSALYRDLTGKAPIAGAPEAVYTQELKYIPLASLPARNRAAYIQKIVGTLIGPGADVQEIAKDIEATLSAQGLLKQQLPFVTREILVLIMSRDEFLSY